MIIRQISVFIEDKPGRLSAFTQLLADNNIDLQALSIAENQEYGILRIIADKPEETAALLRENGWPCTTTKVLAVTVPDEPGSLTKLLSVIADNNISLAYSYAFLSKKHGHACIVLRVKDNDKVQALLTEAGVVVE